MPLYYTRQVIFMASMSKFGSLQYTAAEMSIDGGKVEGKEEVKVKKAGGKRCQLLEMQFERATAGVKDTEESQI